MTSEQTLTVEQIYETLLAEIKELAERKKEAKTRETKLTIDFEACALVRAFSKLSIRSGQSIQQAFKSLELQEKLLAAATVNKL